MEILQLRVGVAGGDGTAGEIDDKEDGTITHLLSIPLHKRLK